MAAASSSATRIIQRPLNNNNFTLATAIFVPAESFSLNEAIPQDRDEKLKRILKNLDRHHNAVRRNMLRLVAVQKEMLLANARELLKIEEQSKQLRGTTAETALTDNEQQEINMIMSSLRHSKNTGSMGREYEYQEKRFSMDALVGTADTSGGMIMGGTGSVEHKASVTLQEELNSALQELAIRTTSEMEAYDKHAESTKGYYLRALQSNAARMGIDRNPAVPASGNVPTPTTDMPSGRGRGILSNRNESSDIDIEALAKTNWEMRPNSPTLLQNITDASGDPRRRSIDCTQDTRTRLAEPPRGLANPSGDLRRKSIDSIKITQPNPNEPVKDMRQGPYNISANIWKTRW